MGEIGINRREFLYDLPLWEARRIIRGYRQRQRVAWEQTRWQTFWLLHNGMLDCRKAGIISPTDLIRFPWDDGSQPSGDQPTAEEIEAMRKHLQELNAKIGQ